MHFIKLQNPITKIGNGWDWFRTVPVELPLDGTHSPIIRIFQLCSVYYRQNIKPKSQYYFEQRMPEH